MTGTHLYAWFAPGPGGATPLVSIVIQFALIFAIFYFLVIRPQQKARKRHEEALRALKRGDEVVTAGGVIGEVVSIKTAASDGAVGMDDRITIRSGDSRLIVERGRIARVTTAGTANPTA